VAVFRLGIAGGKKGKTGAGRKEYASVPQKRCARLLKPRKETCEDARSGRGEGKGVRKNCFALQAYIEGGRRKQPLPSD